MLTKAYILRGYYSSPFKWQGMQQDNSIDLGAKQVRWFAEKGIDPKEPEYLYLGITVGQHRCFSVLPGSLSDGSTGHSR